MTLVKALQATAELSGTRLSQEAAQMLYDDLKAYDEQAVINALARCRRELKGRLTTAEIISRIDDGRPGPDEAWAMLPWDEESTAVLSAEMQQAQGSVRAIYQNDRTGARMAFREQYNRLVTESRNEHRPVEWEISLGTDPAGRAGPVNAALQANQITMRQAYNLLPAIPTSKLLFEGSKLLFEGSKPVPMPEDVRKQIEALAKK